MSPNTRKALWIGGGIGVALAVLLWPKKARASDGKTDEQRELDALAEAVKDADKADEASGSSIRA